MSSPIGIHVDGGKGVGLGHAARAVGVGAALRFKGLKPLFLIDAAAGLDSFLKNEKFHCAPCPAGAEDLLSFCRDNGIGTLLVDSYRMPLSHLAYLKTGGLKVVYFDDRKTLKVRADAVINAAPSALALDYALVPRAGRLLGPKYQVLRPPFVRMAPKKHKKKVSRMLVAIGGDDLLDIFDELAGFLQKQKDLAYASVEIDFIIGPYFHKKLRVKAGRRFYFREKPADMHRFMRAADLALSAGGQTLYELARCGTPTIAFCVGKDQSENLRFFSKAQAIEYIGWAKSRGWLKRIDSALSLLLADFHKRQDLGRRAFGLIDGQGANRVAERIIKLMN